MINKRTFFKKLASGLLVAAAPEVFVPKLIKPAWKPDKIIRTNFSWKELRAGCLITWTELPKDGITITELSSVEGIEITRSSKDRLKALLESRISDYNSLAPFFVS